MAVSVNGVGHFFKTPVLFLNLPLLPTRERWGGGDAKYDTQTKAHKNIGSH
jgi:hypothetical protein